MGKGRGGDDDLRGDGVSTLDYVISLMGYAIGIGNLWRFPYLVGRWGGGAFVVAYLVCLILVACPMYLLELVWGQSMSKNAMGVFRTLHPRWVGVGWASFVMLVWVLTYYNMLLAYSIVYMINAFYSPLPWTVQASPPDHIPPSTTASENFFWNDVLGRYPTDQVIDDDVDKPGMMQWQLVASLFAVWVMVFLALFRGMEASAKVSYVTVGLPILLLGIMLIRALTLEGAGDGLRFYIGKFDSDKLVNFEMWAAACGQILFSLSPGMGTAITLSSYSRKKEDVYKVNMIVTLCNSSFSLAGGFAVFSILGFMSHKSCTDPRLECRTVDELASAGGAGLAFVTLAEGVSQFGDGSNLFAVLFFVMLLTLGLDSTFAWVETVNTYIHDIFHERGTVLRKDVVAAGTAIFFFLCGLPYCTRIGFYLLDVVDHYAASYVLIITCTVESAMLWLDWDWNRVVSAVERATRGNPGFEKQGRQLTPFWYYTLHFTVPIFCVVLFFYSFIEDLAEPYEDYPPFLQGIGWTALLTCILPIIVFFLLNRKEEREPYFENADAPLLPSAADQDLGDKVKPCEAGRAIPPDAYVPPEEHLVLDKQFGHHMQPTPPLAPASRQPAHISKFFEEGEEKSLVTPPGDSEPPPPVPDFPQPPMSSSGQGYTVQQAAVCPLSSIRRNSSASPSMER